MKKLKVLPSLKENKRYVVAEIKIEKESGIKNTIDKALLEFLGVLGYGQAGPMLIKSVNKKGVFNAILSVNRQSVDHVKAAFAFAGIRCLGVSGTLKGTQKFL